MSTELRVKFYGCTSFMYVYGHNTYLLHRDIKYVGTYNHIYMLNGDSTYRLFPVQQFRNLAVLDQAQRYATKVSPSPVVND